MAKHGKIKDNGSFFVIDPASRKVTVPHAHKSISTVGDHNSEQVTFECPKTIDGHDIALCDYRYVTWSNVNGEVGHDELQIAKDVSDGAEGMIYLSWTIRNALTVAKGVVQFSIHFECHDDNNVILYRWSTTTCKDCEILDSVNAVLGAYQAVYVAGDTLVFADFNTVRDGILKIETNGLIPEGILPITENGTFDVGRYAQVDVSVEEKPPEITISEDGKVTATEGGATSEIQLSNEHNPNFLPENIKAGIDIFGVHGTYDQLPLIEGWVVDETESNSPTDIVGIEIWFAGIDPDTNEFSFNAHYRFDSTTTSEYSKRIKIVKYSMLVLSPYDMDQNRIDSDRYYVDCPNGIIELRHALDGSMFLLQAGEDNFRVNLRELG